MDELDEADYLQLKHFEELKPLSEIIINGQKKILVSHPLEPRNKTKRVALRWEDKYGSWNACTSSHIEAVISPQHLYVEVDPDLDPDLAKVKWFIGPKPLQNDQQLANIFHILEREVFLNLLRKK